MSAIPHPWSLKGITPAARKAAKQAAEAEGVTLGTWLTRVIRDVAADQGVTEVEIVVEAAPAVSIFQNRPQVPSRPSLIERLMRRNGDMLPESAG